MKNFTKVILFCLTISCLIYTGCKKVDLDQRNKQKVNQLSQAEVAKKVAFDFYKSLSVQFGSGTHGSSLNTMKVEANCGQVTITPTDKTFLKGDTTVKIKGNSIFTITCGDNYYVSPWDGSTFADGYTLNDSTERTESGSGFANTYLDVLNFVVQKSSKESSETFGVSGKAMAYARFANIDKNNATTEYHEFKTEYNFLHTIGANYWRTNETKFVLGRVLFSISQVDFDQAAVPNTKTTKSTGFIEFAGGDEIYANFKVEGTKSTYLKYKINLKTGQVSEPVEIDWPWY